MINSRAAGSFRFDDKGKLYQYESGSPETDPIKNIDLHGLQGVPNYMVDHIKKRVANAVQGMADNAASTLESARESVVQLGTNIREGFKELGGYIGDQEGTPTAEDYHDTGEVVDRDGYSVLSEGGLKSNGTANTPEAEEGVDQYIEAGDLQTHGTGVSADFVKDKVGQPLNAINRAADAVSQGREAAGEYRDSNEEELRLDTTWEFGTSRQRRFRPDDEN